MQVGVRANKNFETKWARHGKFIADPDRSSHLQRECAVRFSSKEPAQVWQT